MGLIGSITGVVSLIWHINNNKSKLVVKKLDYTTSKKDYFWNLDYKKKNVKEFFKVTMLLRNQSNRSTTIERIGLQLDNHYYWDCYKICIIPANSSKNISFKLKVKEEEIKNVLSRGDINIVTFIHHTFGTKKIKAFGTPNDTGCFSANCMS